MSKLAEAQYGQKAFQTCEVFYNNYKLRGDPKPDTRLRLFGDYDIFQTAECDPEPFWQRIETAWVGVLARLDPTFTADRITWAGRSRWFPTKQGLKWKVSFHLIVKGFVTTLSQLDIFIQHHKQDLLGGLDYGVYRAAEQLFNVVGANKGLDGDYTTMEALPKGGAYHDNLVQYLDGEELELSNLWAPPAVLGGRTKRPSGFTFHNRDGSQYYFKNDGVRHCLHGHEHLRNNFICRLAPDGNIYYHCYGQSSGCDTKEDVVIGRWKEQHGAGPIWGRAQVTGQAPTGHPRIVTKRVPWWMVDGQPCLAG
ncbi:hypothetical protein WJX72_006678 [[Myrmecia] bisecta]|uniref:Uncharacterized protein n=1 Tax=[Myrmecia] bisecta TaxID=41462 RepID=A0AAW1Q926_9CHLO